MGIQDSVCNYCKHIVIDKSAYGKNYGCALTIEGEKYKGDKYLRLVNIGYEAYKKINNKAPNPGIGCEKFESSGLPVHPSVINDMIKANPLAAQIRVDETATQNPYAFYEQMEEYPHFSWNYRAYFANNRLLEIKND